MIAQRLTLLESSQLSQPVTEKVQVGSLLVPGGLPSVIGQVCVLLGVCKQYKYDMRIDHINDDVFVFLTFFVAVFDRYTTLKIYPGKIQASSFPTGTGQ